ncbi:hypothetical protein AADZ90_009475 [Aestuariibius sp. 2305UL40-4]|uniref:hypothetical protein n=1 Tax=Aestuariibius violaceus TaxID=3234132 RepID=UPI00345EB930
MRSFLALFAFAVASGAVYADSPQARFSDYPDEPWSVLPAEADLEALMAPLTYDDILMMADLDGNPSIITDEEARMIALLQQVLLAGPVQ